MRVFVTQRIFPEGLEILEKAGLDVDLNDENNPLPKAKVIERAQKADGLICLLTDTIDSDVISAASNLKAVANVAVGYNNIDVVAANKHQVLVTNTPDVLDDTTADLAFALLLAAARRIPEAHTYTVDGKFEGWELFQPHLGLDVWGKTLGIVGMGRIGQAVARRASGFNMRTLYYNRSRVDTDLEKELNAEYTTFDDLLRESDFVTIHTPLNEDTKYLFGKDSFKKMRKNAILINTSRGPVVDEQALAAALKVGDIAGAALDVFEEEPKVHPTLLELREHVVLVPHIGSATHETRRRMSTLAAENMVVALSGRRPPCLVNPKLWEGRE